jgi:hypothetical protein
MSMQALSRRPILVRTPSIDFVFKPYGSLQVASQAGGHVPAAFEGILRQSTNLGRDAMAFHVLRDPINQRMEHAQ